VSLDRPESEKNTEAASVRPLVSIGFPVYNGEKTVAAILDSFLAQSLTDFELLISDNCSTDNTQALCEAYANRELRIRYIRQPRNLGAVNNFKFVRDQANGRYFMWAAGDDFRTPDFLAENVSFLEAHTDYVASTSPNCMEGKADSVITFAMTGKVEERFHNFFENCWVSHGIFYSVMRTDVIKQCAVVGQSFIAADWAIDLFLACHGKVHRTQKGMTVFGAHGMSSRAGSYRDFRNSKIEWMLPFYRLSCYALKFARDFSFIQKVWLLKTLLKLNFKAGIDQLHSSLYQFYCAHIKPKHKHITPG
jgi:glycosyltransferase involved in cell wall biosynthesis